MQDIKGTLINLTKSVTKTSGDLLKTTKLGMNLSSEETNLKNLYMEIGKKVHEIYQYGGSLGKFFDEKYLELEAAERKIAEIKEQISVIKGVKNCTKCGKTLERTAEFCQKCGIRVELGHTTEVAPASTPVEPAPIPEVPAPTPADDVPIPNIPAPEPVKTVSCRVCLADNEVGTKFCLSCGRILD